MTEVRSRSYRAAPGSAPETRHLHSVHFILASYRLTYVKDHKLLFFIHVIFDGCLVSFYCTLAMFIYLQMVVKRVANR